MNDAAMLATGALCAISYMVAGLGTTRAVASMKGRPIQLWELFMWPIVLGVIAATGDVA